MVFDLKSHDLFSWGQRTNLIIHFNFLEKGRGFITFSKTEATEKAIAVMNAKLCAGIQLTVSLARKQPQIEPINDASSSAVWSTLATSQSQKGNHNFSSRELVSYHDMIN